MNALSSVNPTRGRVSAGASSAALGEAVHSPYECFTPSEGASAPLIPPPAVSSPEPGAAPPETSHHRLGAQIAIGLTLAGAALALTGCTPETDTSVTQAQAGAAVDATQATAKDGSFLHLQIDAMQQARVDLHRETTSSRDSDGTEHAQNVDLSPYGMNLGNGLFLDVNGNLTWNPFTALAGAPVPSASSLTVQSGLTQQTLQRNGADVDLGGAFGTSHLRGDTLQRAWSSDISLTHEGNAVVMHRGLLTTPVTVTQDGNVTTVDRGVFSQNWTITRDGNKVTVDTGGLSPTYTITLNENAASMHTSGLGPDYDVTAADGQMTIHNSGFGSDTHIAYDATHVEVTHGFSTQTFTPWHVPRESSHGDGPSARPTRSRALLSYPPLNASSSARV